MHEFYQEQYQLNNCAQNRYVTGSDASHDDGRLQHAGAADLPLPALPASSSLRDCQLDQLVARFEELVTLHASTDR